MTDAPCSSGPSDAVHVILGALGKVVVYDKLYSFDVDAPGGNVGCNEYSMFSIPESFECFPPLKKRAVGVEFGGGVPQRAYVVRYPFRAEFRPAENEHRTAVFPEELLEKPGLVELMDKEKFMRHFFGGGAGGGYLNAHREFHMPLRHGDNIGGHRRRKKHCLLLSGHNVEYFFKLRRKAHIKHPVRLIEHKHSDVSKRQRPLFEMVDDAAGRADYDMRTSPKRLHLPTHMLSSDKRCRPYAKRRGNLLQRIAYLNGELARREHDKPLSSGKGGLNHRDAKRQCFSCSGLRDADKVFSFNGDGYGLCLNGRGRREPALFYYFQ
jgi:hypothetical protein